MSKIKITETINGRMLTYTILSALFLIPVLFTGAILLTTPSITPAQTLRLLLETPGGVRLIDIRPESEFLKLNVPASINIHNNTKLIEMHHEKKTILIIADSSLSGALAVRNLNIEAKYVEGGIDGWLTSRSTATYTASSIPNINATAFQKVKLSLFEQLMIFTSTLILKPTYMILALFIAFMLRSFTDTLRITIKWTMLIFFAGEAACAVNSIFFRNQGLLMEFAHDFSMFLCISLFMYVLITLIDEHLLHFSTTTRKCALLPICEACYKHNDKQCSLLNVFYCIITATAVIAFLPLTTTFVRNFYEGVIFDHPYIFGHPIIYQVIDFRFLPIVSLLFLALSFIFLVRYKEKGFEPSKIFFAVGVGAISFSLFRVLLHRGFHELPHWGDIWEEITEFIFISALLWFLYKFRIISNNAPFNLNK